MSQAVRGAGGNTSAFFHDTAAVYIDIAARRDETLAVDSLDFNCPQHHGLPLFKSKYLTEVFERRSAMILHFLVCRFHRRPTAKGNHQVRGGPLAGERSKCTLPLCCVAHYVVSALIPHKLDAHHRLPAQSISQLCNTCRRKMFRMPRLVVSPGREPQFQWSQSHCLHSQQTNVSTPKCKRGCVNSEGKRSVGMCV